MIRRLRLWLRLLFGRVVDIARRPLDHRIAMRGDVSMGMLDGKVAFITGAAVALPVDAGFSAK
jgi:hypothetical protein